MYLRVYEKLLLPVYICYGVAVLADDLRDDRCPEILAYQRIDMFPYQRSEVKRCRDVGAINLLEITELIGITDTVIVVISLLQVILAYNKFSDRLVRLVNKFVFCHLYSFYLILARALCRLHPTLSFRIHQLQRAVESLVEAA